MAGVLSQIVAAGRLRLLVSGEVDVANEALLAKAMALLADFTPEERQFIGAKAVELGADEATVATLINLAAGEVIQVVGKPPRRYWWLWLLGGGAAAVGVGSAAGLRARRQRRRLA